MYTYNSKNWGWRRPGGVFLAKVLCLWNKQKTFAYFFNIFLMLSNFIYISQTTKLNEKIKHSNTQSRTELFADPIFLLDAHDLLYALLYELGWWTFQASLKHWEYYFYTRNVYFTILKMLELIENNIKSSLIDQQISDNEWNSVNFGWWGIATTAC